MKMTYELKNKKTEFYDENTEKITDDSLKNVDFDQLLSSTGEFGLYQVLLILFTCPFYVFGAFSYFTQLFMTEVSSDHWCWIPELKNLSPIERRSLAIPKNTNDVFGYSHCTAYVANWTEVLESKQNINLSWPTEHCKHGWEFEKSQIPYPTISSEMGWVCDKDNYQATAQSIFFVGSIIGGLCIGLIADRFGRLPAGIIGNLIGCLAGVCSVFARNFVEFCICRFFMGMSYETCMMMIYLLVLEYVSPKYRTIVANLPTGVFFTLGMIALPWLALYCGNWKTLGLLTSLPMALSLLAPFVIPESPRWLLSRGRVDEAISKVTNIGRVNKKEIPEEVIRQFKLSMNTKPNDNTSSILEVFRIPLLRRMLICICIEFMCCTIIFDALLRSIGSLAFDFFLSFTILSATEFPSLLTVSFTLDLIGRKWISITMMSLCCIFSILTSIVPSGLPSVLCAVVARYGVNICYMVAMQWAAEMLPTPVRGSGTSVVQICGYVATVISPYIVYLKVYIPGLPLIIVGIIAAIGAVAAMFLPETAGKSMPQTFEDAENQMRESKFLDVPFLRKKQ
ncbi:carcinine transporter-like [Maniola hyperantus]|uniref:carcinine transporter-like n=1 Tax=Aphantopus hyperantus TaxID=2795564 RepID=UPI0037495ED0